MTPPWAPTVERVAAVTPSYTRGGYDDDETQAGVQQGVYDDDTSPTATEVEALIDEACNEVEGRCGVTIPERCFGLASTTAVWHVAASISGGKGPGATDDARGEYRALILNYRNSLDELVKLARMPTAIRLS